MNLSEWKKPSDVMKIHRRRKSVSQRRITSDPDKRTSIIYKSPSKPVKRKNPFHRDSPHPFPSKRQHIDFKEISQHDPRSCQLFSLLDTVSEERTEVNARKAPDTTEILKEQRHNEFQRKASTINETSRPHDQLGSLYDDQKEAKPGNEVFAFMPIDWALKTKLRIVSSQPLNWCTQMKSADEAYGVEHFVRIQGYSSESAVSDASRFHRCCMYWIHPNIPWMKLFPRIVDDSKSSIAASYLLDDEIQKSLQADWEYSFTSTYHQLRSRLCPYFYLCTHQFTVLFYNGTESQSGMVAMVTPTTRGFRELLENEGIEFKLPIENKIQSPYGKQNMANNSAMSEDASATVVENLEDVDDEADDFLDTDDAAHGWLESMGLDKKHFPTLDPKKVKLQREGFRVIDHRPESLVMIKGSEVQAFFNFLLNCRSCVAMSGKQAGLPPTILSPTPFKGGTLKTHKVKHTAVKQGDKEGNVTHAHIVEITGPILPCHCEGLVSLLHRMQAADYGIVFNNHEPTIPLNVISKVVGGENDESNLEGNSHEDKTKYNISTILDCIEPVSMDVEKVSQESSCQIDKTKFYKFVPISDTKICALKEVVCTPKGFSWTS